MTYNADYFKKKENVRIGLVFCMDSFINTNLDRFVFVLNRCL